MEAAQGNGEEHELRSPVLGCECSYQLSYLLKLLTPFLCASVLASQSYTRIQ